MELFLFYECECEYDYECMIVYLLHGSCMVEHPVDSVGYGVTD